uniref:Uncharacterized protein n=1 Tax=Arundo donax TaxID=35708 RepID=A0A0A9DDD2_ARUDO
MMIPLTVRIGKLISSSVLKLLYTNMCSISLLFNFRVEVGFLLSWMMINSSILRIAGFVLNHILILHIVNFMRSCSLSTQLSHSASVDHSLFACEDTVCYFFL